MHYPEPNNINCLRRHFGFLQAALARHCKLNCNMVSKYDRGD